MSEISGDWRVLGGVLSAWFDAPSASAGAVLVERLGPLPDVDLRPDGVRLRLRSGQAEVAAAISRTARELGLTADPTVLQEVHLAFEATDPAAVTTFWRTAFGYEETPTGLQDPLDRDPAVEVRPLADPRPLRNRIHVDVVRPSDAVDAVRTAIGQEPYGAWGVALADPEGNEVDLVPGDQLSPEAADWWTNFGAMAFYPTTSPKQATSLVSAVAKLADEASIPLQVDLRPAGVLIDGSKDQWEDDLPNGGAAFVELAKRIQDVAHDLGLAADAQPLRFVQFGIDAVDADALSRFWRTVLGYQPDPRAQVSDTYDPRRLNPVLFFQQLDANDERTKQRNRIHLQLVVPEDQVQARVEAALAAGGRVLDQTPQRCLLSDPEGNELDIR
ncbi:VOC family protein [Kribbella sp. NPDC000426]|uniref:VOC family protein n=1 Tax=Kribbella sp. NPDC000426 TaxID=3154255 RepID=UPI0033274F0B